MINEIEIISKPCPRCKRGAWVPCALWCVEDKEGEDLSWVTV